MVGGGRWNCGADKLLHCFTAWRVGSISKGYPYSQPNRPTAKLPVPIYDTGSTVQRYNGTTVQRFNGSTVQRYNGSTVQRFNGSTVQRFNGSTVQRFNGTQFSLSNSIKHYFINSCLFAFNCSNSKQSMGNLINF